MKIHNRPRKQEMGQVANQKFLEDWKQIRLHIQKSHSTLILPQERNTSQKSRAKKLNSESTNRKNNIRVIKPGHAPVMHLIVGGRSQEKQRVTTDHISELGRLERGAVTPSTLLLDSGGPKPDSGLLALEDMTIDIGYLCIHKPLSILFESFWMLIHIQWNFEASLSNCWVRTLILINLVLININQQPRIIRHLNKSNITGGKTPRWTIRPCIGTRPRLGTGGYPQSTH